MSDHCPTDCSSCVEARYPEYESEPEPHHELRMVTWGNRLVEYCPCGWVASNEMTYGSFQLNDYSERYREHLEDAANG